MLTVESLRTVGFCSTGDTGFVKASTAMTAHAISLKLVTPGYW